MNLEKEYIDFDHLYEVGINLCNYSNQIKENLNNIDSYFKSMNDNKIWNSKSKDFVLSKYLEERENLNLLYQKLVLYSKIILEIVQSSEKFAIQAGKLIEGLNNTLLWPI